MTWRERAACLGLDFRLFDTDELDDTGIATARAVCHSCPVIDECRSYAFTREGAKATNDRGMIYGGMTPRERHIAWKNRTQWVCQECGGKAVEGDPLCRICAGQWSEGGQRRDFPNGKESERMKASKKTAPTGVLVALQPGPDPRLPANPERRG